MLRPEFWSYSGQCFIQKVNLQLKCHLIFGLIFQSFLKTHKSTVGFTVVTIYYDIIKL